MSLLPGSSRWLLRNPSPDARARVFCFPYSGVGASMFSQWPRWIGEVEVCPLQLPARESRIDEPHFGTYQALAEDLVPALVPHLDRPFILFGHCAGALPAFETAYLLTELGHAAPRGLIVSEQVAPHHCPKDRFLDMTSEELAAEVTELIRLRGGEPYPILVEFALGMLAKDLEANRVYHRKDPVSIPSRITVLHWTRSRECAPAELRGWDEYASDVRFRELEGGHYEFLSAPVSLLDLLLCEGTDSDPAALSR